METATGKHVYDQTKANRKRGKTKIHQNTHKKSTVILDGSTLRTSVEENQYLLIKYFLKFSSKAC